MVCTRCGECYETDGSRKDYMSMEEYREPKYCKCGKRLVLGFGPGFMDLGLPYVKRRRLLLFTKFVRVDEI